MHSSAAGARHPLLRGIGYILSCSILDDGGRLDKSAVEVVPGTGPPLVPLSVGDLDPI